MPATNVSYPETGVTKAADLAPEISIDYVSRFTKGIQKLQALLGISNLMPVPEGEYIPLSSVKKALDQTYTLALNKWRRNTAAEAIQSKGQARAINETDAKFVAGVQNLVREDLLTAVTGTSKTSKAGKTLQEALANMWGALEVVFEDYEGFGDVDGGDASKYAFFLLPAHAGMIPVIWAQSSKVMAAPRTRGDDPRLVANYARQIVCSPHTRG